MLSGTFETRIESHNATSLFSLTPEDKKQANDVTLMAGLP
jgi:hypothetical protein